MGGKPSRGAPPRINNEEEFLTEAITNSKLTQAEVRHLFIRFRECSGDSLRPIDKRLFSLLLVELGIIDALVQECVIEIGIGETTIVHFEHQALADDFVHSLFKLFDRNADGLVAVGEFLEISSIILRGSIEDKAAVIFDAYDVNSDGFIRREELYKCLKRSMKMAKKIKDASLKQFRTDLGRQNADDLARRIDEMSKDKHIKSLVEDILMTADKNGDGALDLSEFTQLIREHPELLDPIHALSRFDILKAQNKPLLRFGN